MAPAAHPEDLRISGLRAAGSGDLASLGFGDEKVTVGWQTALPEPQLSGSKATYQNVLPDVDLVVQATATGFEQFTVLKSAAAAKYVDAISLPMTGAGAASVTKDTHGRLRLRDVNGRQRASIAGLLVLGWGGPAPTPWSPWPPPYW